MDTLENIRKQIDAVDEQLSALFEQRMECCREIAAFKAEHGLSIGDPAREEEVVRKGAQRILDRNITSVSSGTSSPSPATGSSV